MTPKHLNEKNPSQGFKALQAWSARFNRPMGVEDFAEYIEKFGSDSRARWNGAKTTSTDKTAGKLARLLKNEATPAKPKKSRKSDAPVVTVGLTYRLKVNDCVYTVVNDDLSTSGKMVGLKNVTRDSRPRGRSKASIIAALASGEAVLV